MRRLGAWLLPLLTQTLAPDRAAACAVCLDSAWGDRGFNGAFVGLMLAPFALAATLAGILVWARARRDRRARGPAPEGRQGG